jgi:hypothetical protein
VSLFVNSCVFVYVHLAQVRVTQRLIGGEEYWQRIRTWPSHTLFILSFVVTQLPSATIYFLINSGQEHPDLILTGIWFNALATLQGATNAVVYGATESRLRAVVLRMVSRVAKNRRQPAADISDRDREHALWLGSSKSLPSGRSQVVKVKPTANCAHAI